MAKAPVDPRYAPFLPDMERAAARLRQQPWYRQGDWRISAGGFQDGQGVFVGMSKANWFNDDFLGIHFEASLEWGGYNLKHVVCVMHVLHQPTFPGTAKDRAAFSVPFVASPDVRKLVRSWKLGCKLNPKSMMVPMRVNAKRTDTNLSDVVFEHFNRYQELAPHIDRVLQEHVLS